MRDPIHQANNQEENPVSYSELVGKILNVEGLKEEAAEAILNPLLVSVDGAGKDTKERLNVANERFKVNSAHWAKNFLPDTTFSVVDIETTGGRPPQHRVTELAAVKLQDGEIVGEYHHLVNPGREIPWSVVRLTGITDAMLVDQPELTEVLPAFLDFLGDSVFVAHCANFDFNFIRYFSSEYLGRDYSPDVLCTFELAQRLLPQAGRYNLGYLSSFLVLDDSANDRHRALGDARTTADIFFRLMNLLQFLELKTFGDVVEYQDASGKEAPSLAEGISIDPATLDDLPTERGVYRLMNDKSETVFSGKATDIQKAVRDIFYPKNRSATKLVQKLRTVRKVEAHRIESELGMTIQALRLRRKSKGMNGAGQVSGTGFLKLSLGSEFPRAYAVNHLSADGAVHYGPFRKQAQLRDLLGAINGVFPLKSVQRSSGSEAVSAADSGPDVPAALYKKLVDRLQRLLEGREGRMRKTSEDSLLILLEEAWDKKGPKPSQLKRNLGRLRHLAQNQSLSGPSVEKKNILIIEPAESMKKRVCYFVRGGILVDELDFDRNRPPVEELAARIQAVYFGEAARAKEPGTEELEEAAIIAGWLRRELIEGFVMNLSEEVDIEEVLESLLQALADPRAAGTCISV
jgi:DNA polymerase-3 subunit epsilon